MWKHDFTVIVDADGTFTGTSTVSDNGGSFARAEDVTGKFNTDRKLISFDTVPVGGGATFKETEAPMNNTSVIAQSTWTANVVEFLISPANGDHRHDDDPRHRVREEPRPVRQGAGRRQGRSSGLRWSMPLNSTQGKK